jgi:hypothetical protein
MTMQPYRFPVWFRAAVAALFTAVFLVYFVVKDGLAGSAFARGLVNPGMREMAPLLDAQSLLAKAGRGAPKGGAYSMNGMRVAFDTLPAPLGARETLMRFAAAYQKAGFKYKVVDVRGETTLVGVHPKTKVMVTAKPGLTENGKSVVRITQQNLGELDPHFQAELPGVPKMPGARGGMLIRTLEGPPTQSLMYAAETSAESVREYYAQELATTGWQPVDAPMQPPADLMTLQFFTKGDKECSVIAMPSPDINGVLVLINIGGRADGRS